MTDRKEIDIEKVADELEEILHPDTRGATLATCTHGRGVGATAHLVLARTLPGTLERVDVRTWTVRYAHGALRPSWGFVSEDPAEHGQKGRVHGGLPTFETALNVALADALSDLAIVVTEVDRKGVDA